VNAIGFNREYALTPRPFWLFLPKSRHRLQEIAIIFELHLFLKQSSHILEICHNATKIHNPPLRLPRTRSNSANHPSAMAAFHPTSLLKSDQTFTINTTLPQHSVSFTRTVYSSSSIRNKIASFPPPHNGPQASSSAKTRIRNDVYLHAV
jgi:hypothetical protein